MYPYLHIGQQIIPSFLIMITLGFILAGILLWKSFQESRLEGYQKWVWIVIVITSIATAMVGTHIEEYIALFVHYAALSSNVEEILTYTSGWFNGFIISVLLIFILLKFLRTPLIYVSDLAAPCIAIGQVCGRIGCFLAGDGCYGRATDVPWGMAFPDGVVPINIAVHPTPLYEAGLLLLIFIFLWSLRHRNLPEGTSIALYLVLAGTERFWVEFIRLNAKVMFNLTAPQLLSVIFLIIGGTMLYRRKIHLHWQSFLPVKTAL